MFKFTAQNSIQDSSKFVSMETPLNKNIFSIRIQYISEDITQVKKKSNIRLKFICSLLTISQKEFCLTNSNKSK